MVISKKDKDKIYESINIVDVIGDFLTLKKVGTQYTCCCPFHTEKTPSFKVRPSTGTWHCFGKCQEGGDAVSFLMKHEGMSYPEALVYLAKKYNIPLTEPTDEEKKEDALRERMRVINNEAQKFFLAEFAKCQEAQEYAFRRWGKQFCQEREIGWAPESGHALLDYLDNEGYTTDLPVELGLLGQKDDRVYDFYRGRITIPIYNMTNNLIGWTARKLDDDNPKVPKYINSKDSLMYNKSTNMFAFNFAKREGAKQERFYLCEGAPDAMRLHSLGIYNCVAALGGHWSEENLQTLKRFATEVCFLPDADEPKEGERPPGTAYVIKNGIEALKQGLAVYVRPIPLSDDGKKQDPDSYITSKEIFNSMDEEDFIIWAAKIIIEEAGDNRDRKSRAVQEVADMVGLIDPVKQEMYLDDLPKITGRRSLWKKALSKIEQRQTRQIEGPGRSTYGEYGFWEENNQIYGYGKEKEERWSNFILIPLFHVIININMTKRIFVIRNKFNEEKTIELTEEDLVSLQRFRVRLGNFGNFLWKAKDDQLNQLKDYLYYNVETAIELTQLGWNRQGFYVFGNGIMYNGTWRPCDKYGMVDLPGKGKYYIPACSDLYLDDDSVYVWERQFIKRDLANTPMRTFLDCFIEVFGDNAKVGFCYVVASLFRDIVVANVRNFPILNLFGPKGSGKSEMGQCLMSFFIPNNTPPNLENTTVPAMGEIMQQSVNALVHFDEFKNDIDFKMREAIKGFWDGTGRTKMDSDAGKKKTTKVTNGVIVSGQEMATADIAAFSRMVFLKFTRSEFTIEEQRRMDKLHDICSLGLSNLTIEMLSHREHFNSMFSESWKVARKDLLAKLGDNRVETRTLHNWTVLLASLKSIESTIDIPFSYTEYLQLSADGLLLQNTYVTSNNEVSTFWQVVKALRGKGKISIGADFRIESRTKEKFDKGASYEWASPHLVLYIRKSTVFSEYTEYCVKTHKQAFPEANMGFYLEQTSGYLGFKKSMRFKNRMNGLNVLVQRNGRTQETSIVDTAYAFDYAQLKELYNLNLEVLAEDDLYDESEDDDDDCRLASF